MTSKLGIRINKTMAKVEIGVLSNRGEEIAQELSNAGAIRTREELDRVQDEYSCWCGDSNSLLTRFFEDGSLAAEFGRLDPGTILEDGSLLENKRTLQKAVRQRVSWLNDLVSRVDGFPQSPSTPIGRWRD